MKFRRPHTEERNQKARSAEMVGLHGEIEPALEFGPREVVLEDVWQRIDGYLNGDKPMLSPETFPFIRLSVLDPELQKKAEQDQDLAGEVQSAIYNRAQSEIEPDFYVNGELAKYAGLFPAVLNGLDESLFPFPHDLQKTLDSFTDYPSREYFIGEFLGKVRGLVQLFPEEKSLIYEKLETIQLWDNAIKQARIISRFRGEVVNHLPSVVANLAIIFPEKTDEILELVRPLWADLQKRLQTWGNSLDAELSSQDPNERPHVDTVGRYVDAILGMVVLAELSHKKKLPASQPLPNRLVA